MENVSITVEAPVNGNEKLDIIKTGFVGFVPVDRPSDTGNCIPSGGMISTEHGVIDKEKK
jgi:hypothetical protein